MHGQERDVDTTDPWSTCRRQVFVSRDDGVALCRCGASSRVAVESHSGVAVSVANNADEGGWCCN